MLDFSSWNFEITTSMLQWMMNISTRIKSSKIQTGEHKKSKNHMRDRDAGTKKKLRKESTKLWIFSKKKIHEEFSIIKTVLLLRFVKKIKRKHMTMVTDIFMKTVTFFITMRTNKCSKIISTFHWIQLTHFIHYLKDWGIFQPIEAKLGGP